MTTKTAKRDLPKKTYRAPKLLKHGTIATITLGGAAGSKETNSTGQSNKRP